MSDLDEILNLGRERDRFAAIERIASESDALGAAKRFVEVMRHFYWTEKNLPAAVAFGQAGAHFGLFHAARIDESDAALATQLRGVAKGLMYDLASFTWPGWDEPGIPIMPADLAVGLDAAKANLRLARELNKGDLPLSRAHWMLAGHQLCAKDFAAARASYEQAGRHAAAAGSKADELLAAGFGRLVELLQSDDTGDDSELRRIQEQLRGLENGPDFVQQIETARRVFQGSPSR
ncbi:MAG TPA: hypothetical protein VGI81_18765 [Tepidisphaeraceae bacterium]|jgi:hypothetical protein